MSNTKVIFIGDIVGGIARKATVKILPKLKKKYQPDVVIANAENLAHGKGVTKKTINQMKDAGIDMFTSGNHVWKLKEAYEILNQNDSLLIRPANYPNPAAGMGIKEIKIGKKSLFVVNLMGRVFFKETVECPFRTADKILKKIDEKKCLGVIIDFHAEATSEKVALKHYLDGRISALLGTHTHIQTADEEITDNGTAYITDVGAVMAKDSIIGVEKENIIKTFITQINYPHTLASKGLTKLNAIYLEIDSKSKKVVKIERITKEINI